MLDNDELRATRKLHGQDDGLYEDKMSKADKILEELGYKKIKTTGDNLLEYEKQFPEYSKFIRFDLLDRTFTSFYYGIDMQSYLNIQELQAINMKCKELGWI